MLIRLTGTESEIDLGVIRLRQAFAELIEISEPHPSDEQPDLVCVDVTAWF